MVVGPLGCQEVSATKLDEGLSNFKEDVMDFHKVALAVMIVIPIN